MAVGETSLPALALHLSQVASGGVAAAMADVAAEVAEELERRVRTNIQARLTMRSRSLLTSTRGDVAVSPEAITVHVAVGGDTEGLRVRYAQLQELGGTVVPVNAKYLAIPIGPALLANGIPRAPSPRLVPGLAFAQSKGGQPMLVKKSGPNAGEVWYLLRRKVEIQPKFYLRDAAASVLAELPSDLAAVVATRIVE